MCVVSQHVVYGKGGAKENVRGGGMKWWCDLPVVVLGNSEGTKESVHVFWGAVWDWFGESRKKEIKTEMTAGTIIFVESFWHPTHRTPTPKNA